MAGAAMGMAFRHLRDLFGSGSVVGLGDGQLLARYSGSKDEVAFEALMARHGPMVLATCRAVLRNEQDVEDAFQATFLVLARKAGSVRGGDALGGWLHRVAYRASVEASIAAKKRRRKEAEASAMAPLDASRSDLAADPELRPIVHEEVDRLPESERLAVVLCDLQGMTYEQAAEQLRWTVPTLRCRLARARQRLKGRLARRGVTAGAVGVGLVPNGASAAVPAALVRSTVLAATAGPASAGAALLTHILLRGMFMTKLKIAATAALAALAVASAGVLAVGSGRPDDPKPATKPAAGPEAGPSTAPKRPEPEQRRQTVEVKGRVVGPDGRPVAGAAVRSTSFGPEVRAEPSATSGPDGRFSIRLPTPKSVVGAYQEEVPWLVASAPGFGVGWTKAALRADRPDEQVLSLVEEGPPLEGRIVDLEGRAVAGARVEVTRIWFEGRGDLPGWIARARNGAAGNLWQGLENLPMGGPEGFAAPVRPPGAERLVDLSATTGPDGRFRLTGVGRDRVAELLASGPGIATTQVYAFSRPEAEVRGVNKAMINREPFVVHSPRFELALPPSRRVEGVVRDKDSAKPIAGLGIKAAVFDESSLIPAEGISAITDADGRYRLDGLPRGAAYRLFIKTAKGIPYTNATFKAPAGSPGMEPVTYDFAMKRGVIVRGRVTDEATGRPVQGHANYYAFADNPNVRDFAGFSQSYEQYAYLDEDGGYEVVALPGRGIVAVRDQADRYRPAVGYEKIAGYDPKFGYFGTVPRSLSPGGQAVLAEIHPKTGIDSLTLDLQADPGKSVPIEVIGPDGAPLGDTKVKGLREQFQTGPIPQPSSSFEVHALDPGKPRRVIVMHEGRKLIGTALLEGGEAGPITIKLGPWGSVSGRVVDDEGRPRKGMFIGSPNGSENKRPGTHDVLPGSDWNQGIWVGDDGRFRVEALVPGLKYDAVAGPEFSARGDLFTDVTVAPGEAKDLGDLEVQPPKTPE